MFDPESPVGRRYLDYLEARARIWAERYVDGREPDYRGDETLRRFHFCNVWRELDRYSRWEIAEIRGRPLAEQVDIVAVGRMTMVPATVWKLLAGATADDIRRHADERRAAGLPWFSQALTIHSYGAADFAAMFVRHRDGYAANRRRIIELIGDARDAQAVADALPGMIPSVGKFRAYEMATSLTYSEHLPRLREDDLFHIGPGAVDGLEAVVGARDATRGDFESLRVAVLRALAHRRAFRWIPPEWQGSPHHREARKFTLRTLEDSMCEFRKYLAMSGAGGKARRRTYRRMDVAA